MNICGNSAFSRNHKLKNGMNEQTNAPKISDTDLDQPNSNDSSDETLDSSATLPDTQDALQANDAERMTPDEANELSNEE